MPFDKKHGNLATSITKTKIVTENEDDAVLQGKMM
jgi:hypothetical protein